MGRVVGMGGDHGHVGAQQLAGGQPHRHAVLVAGHRSDRGGASSGATLLGEPLQESLDIDARAADDGAPGRGTTDGQHPVVVEEREQVPGLSLIHI